MAPPRRPSRRAIRLSLNWQSPPGGPPKRRNPAAGGGGAEVSQADTANVNPETDGAQALGAAIVARNAKIARRESP